MQRHTGRDMWDMDECQSPRMGSVILGVDGGASNTVCVCIPAAMPFNDPLPVLARTVAGCSNHNSFHSSNDRWTYEDQSWARIADLLPVVVESAESGDEVANKILHNSVGELASSVKAVVQRLELGGEGNTKSSVIIIFQEISFTGSFFDERRVTERTCELMGHFAPVKFEIVIKTVIASFFDERRVTERTCVLMGDFAP